MVMDSDDEDVLFSSEKDRLQPTTTPDVTNVENLDGILYKTKGKMKKTICLVYAFICLGMCTAIIGPTLPDLQEQVDSSNPTNLKFLFASRGVGYLFGSMVTSVTEGCCNHHTIIALSLFFASIAMATIAVTKSLSCLVFMMTWLGFTTGILETGVNEIFVKVWGKRAPGFLKMIHLAFAVGAVLVVLLLIPFKMPTATDLGTTDVTTVTADQFTTTALPNRRRRGGDVDPNPPNNKSTTRSLTTTVITSPPNEISTTPILTTTVAINPSTTTIMPTTQISTTSVAPNPPNTTNTNLATTGSADLNTYFKEVNGIVCAPNEKRWNETMSEMLTFINDTLKFTTLQYKMTVLKITDDSYYNSTADCHSSKIDRSEYISNVHNFTAAMKPHLLTLLLGDIRNRLPDWPVMSMLLGKVPKSTSEKCVNLLKNELDSLDKNIKDLVNLEDSQQTFKFLNGTIKEIIDCLSKNLTSLNDTKVASDFFDGLSELLTASLRDMIATIESMSSNLKNVVDIQESLQNFYNQFDETTTPPTATPGGTETSNRPVNQVKNLYFVISAFFLPISIIFLYLTVKSPIAGDVTRGDNSKQQVGDFEMKVLIVVFLFSLLYRGAELSIGAFISQYYFDTPHLNEAAYLYAAPVFWGFFTVRRVISLLYSPPLSPSILLTFDLAGSLSSLTLFTTLKGENLMLFSTGMLGFFMANLYHCGLDWLKSYLVSMRKVHQLSILGTSLGESLLPLSSAYFLYENGDSQQFIYLLLVAMVIPAFMFGFIYIVAEEAGEKQIEQPKDNFVKDIVSGVQDAVKEKDDGKKKFGQVKQKIKFVKKHKE